MRAFEFLTEAEKPKVGRAWQHAEDLVIVDGSSGAHRALDALESMATDVSNVRIKWDGCIHPDSLVDTSNGPMRIEDVIDSVDSSQPLSVLQYDFDRESLVYAPIVYAVKKSGEKDWLEIELENGDTIRLTEDHEVYTTNRGWVEAKDLTTEDDIKHITK